MVLVAWSLVSCLPQWTLGGLEYCPWASHPTLHCSALIPALHYTMLCTNPCSKLYYALHKSLFYTINTML